MRTPVKFVFGALLLTATECTTQMAAAQDMRRLPGPVDLLDRIDVTPPALGGEGRREHADFTGVKGRPYLDFIEDRGIAKEHPRVVLPRIDDRRRQLGVIERRKRYGGYVQGELLLMGRNKERMALIANEIGAKLVADWTIDARDKVNPVTVTLIALDPLRNPADAVLKLLNEQPRAEATGRYGFSSTMALATVATALELEVLHAKSDIVIGMNWVMPPYTLENEWLIEGVNSQETGFINPFFFNYFTSGSVQDTGVTDAWHFLKAAGVLNSDNRSVGDHRVPVAVIDGGFHSGLDLANPVASGAPLDTPNIASCSGGATCPWHGSGVSEVLAGRLGNGRAAAGVAGPVADLLLHSSEGYDLVSLLNYATLAGAGDFPAPRIINMSFGGAVPAMLAFTTAPLDHIMTNFTVMRVNLVAAAGNSNVDVDEVECVFGVCIEVERHIPCELSFVICVGALDANSNAKAGFSNFGVRTGLSLDGNTVDIFAPGTSLFVGPDPQFPGGVNILGQSINGTSVAAPFVAGTLALMIAANPTRGPFVLSDRLMATASTGVDLPLGAAFDPLTPRRVNVGRAVRRVLFEGAGTTDFPPSVSFLAPRNTGIFNPSVEMNQPATLRVNAVDVEAGIPCCTIAWSIDGVEQPQMSGATVTHVFTENRAYNLAVTVTDAAGQTDTATVRVLARP